MQDNWKNKFLMVVDGNTFNSRLRQTLASGSLVMRAGLFVEWFEERMQDGVHYLKIKLDYSDLQV